MPTDPAVLLVKPLLCPPPSLTPHTPQHLPIASLLLSAITHCALATCQLSGTFSQRPLGQTLSANHSIFTFNTHPELAISSYLCHYHPGLSRHFFYEDYCLLIGLPVWLTLLQSALHLAAYSPASNSTSLSMALREKPALNQGPQPCAVWDFVPPVC